MQTLYLLPVPGVDRNLAINTEACRRPIQGRQNDYVAVNRMRGVMSEFGRLEALLLCGQRYIVGTHNVNENRAAERDQCRKEAGEEILGVQEHRIMHIDSIEFRRLGTSCLITSSGWRSQAQASQRGICLLFGTKARKVLLKIKSISNKIMAAEFDGNPKTASIVGPILDDRLKGKLLKP